MSHDIEIEGKSYISSKRAAEITGYAQDYIGQLARKNLIDARRIGGLWYVLQASLEAYKATADNFKPQPPVREEAEDQGKLLLFDGKEYISASRAAEITGYNQDYVGQLARSNTVLSHQIGNRWYIEKDSLVSHKEEKDSLLRAVQAQSVGLSKQDVAFANKIDESQAFLNYSDEKADLMPIIGQSQPKEFHKIEIESAPIEEKEVEKLPQEAPHSIRIRRIQQPAVKALPQIIKAKSPIILPERAFFNSNLQLAGGALATIVIVLAVGYASLNELKQHSAYAANIFGHSGNSNALSASVEQVFSKIEAILEPFFSHEIQYQRPQGN